MRLPRMTTRRWILAAACVVVLMVLGRETVWLRGIAHTHRQKAAGFATVERDNRTAADAMEACAQVRKQMGGRTAYWELHRFAVVDYIRRFLITVPAALWSGYRLLQWAGVAS
jgi:hypothetical protein